MADQTGLPDLPVTEPSSVTMRVALLGPFVAEVDGRPVHVAGSHRRRLLAFLASRAGQTVSVEAIIDALWGDDPPRTAQKTLQSHVVRLRQSLGAVTPSPIETAPSGYRLAVGEDAVDVARFAALAAEGHARLSAADHAMAARCLTDALELWRGEAYLEFTEAGFARVEAARLGELRATAIEDLAESEVYLGGARRAVHRLERLVVEAPGRERAWGLLMRALFASGRQHEALDAYQRARHVLAKEFGLEPGPELRAVERQIVRQDPSLTVGSGQVVLAAALRTSRPMVGRHAEREALLRLWAVAREGLGRFAVVRGAIDSGRTRLLADLAGRVVADGGAVEYVRGSDGFAALDPAPPSSSGASAAIGAAVLDAVARRFADQPLLLVVDDVEWLPPQHAPILTSLALSVEDLPALVVVSVDPSSGGPVVSAVERLGASGAVTIDLDPMSGDEIAAIVIADGVEDEAVRAVTATAGGFPASLDGRPLPGRSARRATDCRLPPRPRSAGRSPPPTRRRWCSTRCSNSSRHVLAGTRCAAPSGRGGSPTGRLPRTARRTPSCSSGENGSSPNSPRESSSTAPWRSSAPRAAASRRSSGPG
jgi:DNA-binding SARP family transcriptional activator